VLRLLAWLLGIAALSLASFGEVVQRPNSAGNESPLTQFSAGPNPVSMFATVRAEVLPAAAAPKAPVTAVARTNGLDHPQWLYVLRSADSQASVVGEDDGRVGRQGPRRSGK
jgi:hypothetical protein